MGRHRHRLDPLGAPTTAPAPPPAQEPPPAPAPPQPQEPAPVTPGAPTPQEGVPAPVEEEGAETDSAGDPAEPAEADAEAPAPDQNGQRDITPAPVQSAGPSDTLDEHAARIAVTAQDDLYTLTADKSGLWKRGSDGWSPLSGAANAVYAGRAGVFTTADGNEQVRKYNAATNAWNPIGGAAGQFAVTGKHLYRLVPDGIGEWHGDTWTKIGGPARNIYAGRAGLFATNPHTGDLYKYNGKPGKWTRIGGPGAQFAVGHDRVYGINPDHTAVYEWTGQGTAWTKIGGPAKNIYAGGAGLFATNPTTGNIHQYNNTPDAWTEIGGPGATFTVSDTQLYGLSPDLTTAYRWNGTGADWTRLGGAADIAQQHKDEQLLAESCGQECVEEYREAKKLLETSITDWLKDNGLDILLDTFDINDIVKCAQGDLLKCLWTVTDVGSTLLGVGAVKKTGKLASAIKKTAKELPPFLKKADEAKKKYRDLRTLIDTARKVAEQGPAEPERTPCPVAAYPTTQSSPRAASVSYERAGDGSGQRGSGLVPWTTQAETSSSRDRCTDTENGPGQIVVTRVPGAGVTPQPPAAASSMLCAPLPGGFDRFKACEISTGKAELFRGGLPVGTVHFVIRQEVQLKNNSLTSLEDFNLQVTSVTGDTSGTTLTLDADCRGTCKTTSPVSSRQDLTANAVVKGIITHQDSPVSAHSDKIRYAIKIERPGFSEGATNWHSPIYRCDDTIKGIGAGCVFPEYVPTLTEMQRLPGIAANIRRIQQGSPSHLGNKALGGVALTRTTSATLEQANRRTACPRSRPRPSGQSCDEYPFAKTREGASRSPAADWGWAWVPVGEQNSQGGLVSGFFKAQRVLDGDKFWVEV